MAQAIIKATTKLAARRPRYKPTSFDHGAVRAQHMPFRKAVGERLRIARAALNITIEEAASACGITAAEYHAIEAGKPINGMTNYRTLLDKGGIVEFCLHYEVSLDWMLCGDGRFLKPHLARRAKVAILPIWPYLPRDDEGKPL